MAAGDSSTPAQHYWREWIPILHAACTEHLARLGLPTAPYLELPSAQQITCMWAHMGPPFGHVRRLSGRSACVSLYILCYPERASRFGFTPYRHIFLVGQRLS